MVKVLCLRMPYPCLVDFYRELSQLLVIYLLHLHKGAVILNFIHLLLLAAEKRADKVVKNSSPQFVEPFKEIMLTFFNKGKNMSL